MFGISCPNEAEFCGYDILLHLTEGNVLNLVEKYSPAIRQHPPVRFAVEVALALDSNNFVRFFKMVKHTTFLNACIMHGYFSLVRTRALKTMNRAHSVMRKPAPFPLPSVARMLAFENDKKAGEFCCEFQLVVSDSHVEFIRRQLRDPAEAIPRRKSPHLVDFKNTKSLGEFVNGGPLPPRPIHRPYSSFSPGARLLSREPSPLPPQAPPTQTQLPAYSIMDMTTAVNDIISEVAHDNLLNIVQESIQEKEGVELKEEAQLWLCSSLMDEVVLKESKEVAMETYLEEEDRKSVREELSGQLVERVIQEVVAIETHLVIQEAYRDCVVEAESQVAALIHVTTSLVEEGVCEAVKGVAEEVLIEAWEEKLRCLGTLKVELERRRMFKYWKRWLRVLEVRQHVHKCVAAIPPLPPPLSLPWQLETLLPNEKRRRVESQSISENRVAKMLEESREEREKKRREFYSPLDLLSLLRESLLLSRLPVSSTSSLSPSSFSSSTHHVFWKLVFVHPGRNKLNHNDTGIVEWLHHKLQLQPRGRRQETSLSPPHSLDKVTEPHTLSLVTTQFLSSATQGAMADSGEEKERVNVGDQQRKVCVVVKALCDEALEKSDGEFSRELCGTCAMAVFLPTLQHSNDYTTKDFVAYVHRVVEVVVSRESFPRVPLLVICSNEMEEKFLATWIQIRMALATSCHPSISLVDYLQVDLTDTTSSRHSEQLLSRALCQLAKQSPPQPNLFHLPMREFVEQGLLKHFVSLVVADSDTRKKACLPSQPPAPIVSLYNDVIGHLIKMATSDKLRTLNWPLTEFVSSKDFSRGAPPPLHWNSAEYLARIHDCLTSLMLPTPPSHTGHADWSEQCAQCLDYVRSVNLSTDDVMAIIPLMSRAKALLYQAEDQSELFVPWDQVILICAEHMVAYLNSDLWVSGFHGDNTDKFFTVPSDWIKAQATTTLDSVAQVTSRDTSGPMRKRRRHKSDPPCVEVTTPLPYSHSPHASLSVGVSPATHGTTAPGRGVDWTKEEDKLRLKLEASLMKEKALSQSFEAQLQQWLSPAAVTNSLPPAKKKPPRSRRSVELEVSWLSRGEEEGEIEKDFVTSSGDRSIRQGLKQLRKKIRLAKYLDTKDNILLHSLANTPPSQS